VIIVNHHFTKWSSNEEIKSTAMLYQRGLKCEIA